VESLHHAFIADDKTEKREQDSKDRLHWNLAALTGLPQDNETAPDTAGMLDPVADPTVGQG
jgi:hypothetical protein